MAEDLSGGIDTVVRDAMTVLGGQVLTAVLAADRGHEGARVPCGEGHHAGFVAYRDKTIGTVLGPVTITRAWYHCRACQHGHAPLDRQLDVDATARTPGLRAMIDIAAAAGPFTAASRLLTDLAGLVVRAKTIERVAEADGLQAESEHAERAEAVLSGRLVPIPPTPKPGSPIPDMLYVAIDGTGVPMQASETRDRKGKYPDGRARTREVKLAALFTQTTTDRGRAPGPGRSVDQLPGHLREHRDLRHADQSRRPGTRPRPDPPDRPAGRRSPLDLDPGRQTLPRNATQIVDLFHAREHLHALAGRSGVPAPPTRKPGWLHRLADLDAGNIEALAAAARHYHRDLAGPIAEQVDKAVAYFETNTHRMRYAHYRSLGMFIGSGVVEAGCKARHRPTPQTIRHALDHPRRHRHHHPALPTSQRSLN